MTSPLAAPDGALRGVVARYDLRWESGGGVLESECDLRHGADSRVEIIDATREDWKLLHRDVESDGIMRQVTQPVRWIVGAGE